MEKETNSRELRAIEYISFLDTRLDGGAKYLEERLRSVPDLWRQYRIAQVSIDKVVRGLYKTLPMRTLVRMLRANEISEIVIRPKSVLNESTDSMVVLNKDLDVLIDTCIESQCSLCLKVGKDAKECKLRKALLNISPLDNLDDGFLCGYANFKRRRK